MAISWTLETTPSAGTQGWIDVIWVPAPLSLYVAGGGGNPNKFMTSPDSITWTARPKADVRNARSLAWSPTLSILVALSGSASNQCVFTSPDAINWTLQPATPYGAARAMFAVCWGVDRFVAVGNRQIMYSLNGTAWTASGALPDALAQLVAVCYDPITAKFIALANNSADINIMSSPDGITWTGHHGFEVAYKRAWTSIAADGAGNIAAVCTGGTTTQQVMSSTGNLDDPWTFETTPQDPNNDLQWACLRQGAGAIRWIAVGRQVNTPRDTGYLVMTYSAGVWTPEVTPVDTENVQWKGVCYSTDLAQYVAVGFRELDHTTEALGGILSNDVEIEGSGGLVLDREDNGIAVASALTASGGLVLNRAGSGIFIPTVLVADGGLVLYREGNGISPALALTGDGGLVLNRGNGNGITAVQCRDDWTNPGALPYVPLNVSEAAPPATECSDEWGPSAPGALPYIPLQ